MAMTEQGVRSGSDGKQTPYTAFTARKMFACFVKKKAIVILFNHYSKLDLYIYFENVLSQLEELTSLLALLPPD